MSFAGHSWSKPKKDNAKDQEEDEEEEEEDPFDQMIERSGCSKQHFALQDCMFDNKDWRKCQDHVKSFKECMMNSNKKNKT